MNMNLSLYETRVIGCLIEKAITTPDQYPLSLNALVNACNQKSNREPVLELQEATVQDIVDGLIKKYLVSRVEAVASQNTNIASVTPNLGFCSYLKRPPALFASCSFGARKRMGNCETALNGCVNSKL